MHTVSASIDAITKRRGVGLAARRYSVYLTERQEDMILAECVRRGMPFAEFMRRILDGWVERKIQQEAGQ